MVSSCVAVEVVSVRAVQWVGNAAPACSGGLGASPVWEGPGMAECSFWWGFLAPRAAIGSSENQSNLLREVKHCPDVSFGTFGCWEYLCVEFYILLNFRVILSALFKWSVCFAVLWHLMGCLWLFFVVSFLICFQCFCWEGVEDRPHVCVRFFVLFIEVLAVLLSLCSLGASLEDLLEFHFWGLLRCRILSYPVIFE